MYRAKPAAEVEISRPGRAARVFRTVFRGIGRAVTSPVQLAGFRKPRLEKRRFEERQAQLFGDRAVRQAAEREPLVGSAFAVDQKNADELLARIDQAVGSVAASVPERSQRRR